MATKEVLFPPGVQTAGATRVYLKQRWDHPWSLIPGLQCLEASKTVSPALPVATLFWKYGMVKTPKDIGLTLYAKQAIKRWFVKIEIDTADSASPWRWYGVVEDIADRWGGNASGIATGSQQITCYGLEKLLADRVITTSHIWVNGIATRIGRALTFNWQGRPNRTKIGDGITHLFEANTSEAEFWSVKDIVEYLLEYEIPAAYDGYNAIPFEVDGDLSFLDWDRAIVPQDGMTTYHLLSRLLDRRRLVVWWLDVREGSGQQGTVLLKFASLADTDVVVSVDDKVIPSNSEIRHLRCGSDPMTRVTVVDAETRRYDQVRVIGPRIRVVGTFSLQDQTLVAGWKTTDQSEYDAGASTDPSYPGASTAEKQRMNEEVRSSPKLADVYRIWVLPTEWDGRVGDGLGGQKNPLFLHRTNNPFDDDSYTPYTPDMRFEESLPLKKGVDYSGGNIANGNAELPKSPSEEIPPIVLMKRPDNGRWVSATELGAISETEIIDTRDNPRFSLDVTMAREVPGIRLQVLGQPQHAIAYGLFVPLPEDYDVGQFDVSAGGMVATLSLPSDWYVETVWPKFDDETAPELDAVRQKIIHSPDRAHQVYVAPQTVVGVKADGTLIRSDGGWIGKDDFDQLESVARVAASWYTREHIIVHLTTGRVLSPTEVDLGNMIGEVGTGSGSQQYREANSVVTSITVEYPLTEPGGRSAPSYRLTTWAGELDSLAILADPTESKK